MRAFKSRSWRFFIVFLGWMLSPATWWDDAFVNIPIAYLLASLVAWAGPRTFLVAFIVFYWGTNLLGSWMLWWVAGVCSDRPRARSRNG
jgi:hypothetical protein